MKRYKYLLFISSFFLLACSGTSSKEQENKEGDDKDYEAYKTMTEKLNTFEKNVDAYCKCLETKNTSDCQDLAKEATFFLSKKTANKLKKQHKDIPQERMSEIIDKKKACRKKAEAKEKNIKIDTTALQKELKSWMRTNLNVKKFRNGNPIPQANNEEEWDQANEEEKPVYYVPTVPNYKEKMGVYYNWYAVNDSRGLAPEGWKIPSVKDYKRLLNTMGGKVKAFGYMTDTAAMGFATMPLGGINSFGNENPYGRTTCWWTSDKEEGEYSSSAYCFYISTRKKIEIRTKNFKAGLPVRCIRK